MSIEGLLFHEIVLLILGIILFLVLLVLLVVLVVQKRAVKGLLAFFLVPVLMIGYPSVQKIEYGDWLVELERETEQLEGNPDDPAAREELAETTRRILERNPEDPSTKLALAKAKVALGDTLVALNLIDEVRENEPDNIAARQLRRQFLPPRQSVLETLRRYRDRPLPPSEQAELSMNLRDMEQSRQSSLSDFVLLSHGYSLLGDSSKTVTFADSARSLDSSVELPPTALRFLGDFRRVDTAGQDVVGR